MMELPKAYGYLDTMLLRIIDHPLPKKWIIDEYNLSGSRYSGKTTSITIEIGKTIAGALNKNKKVAWYAFRFLSRQVKDLVEEITIALDDIGLDYQFKNKDNTFRFANGSFIAVNSVYSPTGRINLKGLAKCYQFDYAIRWVEEANELDKKDYQAIDFAIRGAKNFIRISTCNPDIIYQDHITYLNDNCPFVEGQMKTYNQQFEIQNKYGFRKLFHYTNWKMNPYLSLDLVKQLEELRIQDPIKAKVWYYGMPGALSGSVFSNYLEGKRTTLDFQVASYSAGLDLGYSESPAGHPTCAMLVGMNRDKDRFHNVAEYRHSNLDQTHKTPTQLCQELVHFFLNKINSLFMSDRLVVQTDYGAGGLVMIDLLNNICKEKGVSGKLIFVPVDKDLWFIKDRVEAMQIMLSTKQIGWSDNECPALTKGMSLMKYKEVKNKESYKVDIVDLNDDEFDALCYAIMPYLKKAINSIKNPLLKSKQLQERLV